MLRVVSDVATAPGAVSGWVTLRRAAIGAGLALAACTLIQLLGRPVGAFLDATVVIWSVVALYNSLDHRCRTAVAAAVLATAAVWFAAAPLLDAGLPGAAARAAVSIVLASQLYAAVTHLR
ncbi:hypothetical protein ADL15_26040 [Actinoplanes awajinensis subsp. mycoplanecinus]|uniref:Uncharacterized protein n=1 Tax=Actinoplanes awajinensis subsp. mycoplanecinus TaxID=135947 RepID=A0A101JNG5_9ACTN|nr:hypothetical protein ADL15_26040 [Actinoplanes awajinensis subsp. mycoplanecinus]